MTEKTITAALFRTQRSAAPLMVNNAFIYDWESDVIAKMRSGYTAEFEIKISRADLKKDAMKTVSNGHTKYEQLQKGAGPNRFYYVLQADLYGTSGDIIPDWAGVFTVTERYGRHFVTKVREATVLHKAKITQAVEQKIIMAAYWKNYNRVIQNQH